MVVLRPLSVAKSTLCAYMYLNILRTQSQCMRYPWWLWCESSILHMYMILRALAYAWLKKADYSNVQNPPERGGSAIAKNTQIMLIDAVAIFCLHFMIVFGIWLTKFNVSLCLIYFVFWTWSRHEPSYFSPPGLPQFSPLTWPPIGRGTFLHVDRLLPTPVIIRYRLIHLAFYDTLILVSAILETSLQDLRGIHIVVRTLVSQPDPERPSTWLSWVGQRARWLWQNGSNVGPWLTFITNGIKQDGIGDSLRRFQHSW